MGVMLFLVLVGLLMWALLRNPLELPAVKQKINDINGQWISFVAGYHKLAKDDAERDITRRMLEDLRSQGMYVPAYEVAEKEASQETSETSKVAELTARTTIGHIDESITLKPTPDTPDALATSPQTDNIVREPMDNTSILLYFGAFLLVAAAGLFVSFGGASGGLRTLIIAVVMAVFYGVGFWLWYGRTKLRQAALTFVGIGIVLAPVVGLAAYSYVFHSSPEAVWLATSAGCLALYTHALWVLRNPLLEYVFIGTFLSLFESAIAMIHPPLYYFGWGTATVGLIVQIFQITRGRSSDFSEPTAISSNVLIPLSLLVAMAMIPQHGVRQLAVSLLLAALFYGVQAWQAKTDEKRIDGGVASELLTLASVGLFAYSIDSFSVHVAVALVLASLPLFIYVLLRKTAFARASGLVLIASLTVACIAAWPDAWYIVYTLSALVLGSLAVWLRHRRDGAYVGVIGAAIAALIVAGLKIYTGENAQLFVAELLIAFGAIQIAALMLVRNSMWDNNSWRVLFQAGVISTLLIGLIYAAKSSPTALLVTACMTALMIIALMVYDAWQVWSTFGGLVIMLPLFVTFSQPRLFLLASIIALVWNMAISWWLASETNRALSVALWLLLPLSIAHVNDGLGTHLYFMVAYGAVAALLLAIRYFVLSTLSQEEQASESSADEPISGASLQKSSTNEGDSYTVGFMLAGLISVLASYGSERFLPVAATAWFAVLVYVACVYVERRAAFMAVLPVLAQFGLWLTFRSSDMLVYIGISTLFAVAGYYVSTIGGNSKENGSEGYYLRVTSLIAVFVSPLVYLLFGVLGQGNVVWTMPWSVLVAGGVLLHSRWEISQAAREWSGAVITLGVFAIMQFAEVHNIQAYGHVMAALFAGYAYWRYYRGEKETSDQYVLLALAAATIPLVVQALVGTAGDFYGWWLLIEQVGIMLVGMFIHKQIMVRWGLYVALASVIYQLRNLGWAALTVLAVFLIGLAVYRLQKTEHKTN